jgi:hypothetical protein
MLNAINPSPQICIDLKVIERQIRKLLNWESNLKREINQHYNRIIKIWFWLIISFEEWCNCFQKIECSLNCDWFILFSLKKLFKIHLLIQRTFPISLRERIAQSIQKSVILWYRQLIRHRQHFRIDISAFLWSVHTSGITFSEPSCRFSTKN